MEAHTHLSKQLSHVLTEAIHEYIFPGAVAGVVTKNGDRLIVPVGNHTYEEHAPSMKEDSIFDVASITKTVPTSLLALKLIEEKKLSLTQRVHTILPLFSGKWKKDITVFHLLTQSVDFGLQLSQLKNLSPDEILQTILICDLVKKPGTTYAYTNSTSIVLGLVVENISGVSLSQLAQEKLFTPLQMPESSFDPSQFSKDCIVPTEVDPWRGKMVQGEVHDESAFILSKKGYIGSAGLFTTVPDLLNVLEMVIHQGMFRGTQVFSDKTVSQMVTNQLDTMHENSGLGWEMNMSYMGRHGASDMIGKTGFTGCMIVCDLKHKIGIVLLSNYHFPHRKKQRDSLISIRRAVVDTVCSFLL